MRLEIGDYIKIARLKRHLSQQELARRAGISRGTIVKIESGEDCKLSTLVELCKMLTMELVLADILRG